MRHIQNMAKVMLATGLIVLYGYAVEAFMGWYSANPYEGVHDREPDDRDRTGTCTGSLIFCNGVMPQTLWFKKVRTNIPLLFVIALIVNVGMWLERYVIVVTSLSRDFLPSSWGMYAGTMWDWMTYVGTLGLFAWLLFLFLRLRADDLDVRDADDRARGHGGRARGALRTPWQHQEISAQPVRPDGRVPTRRRRSSPPRAQAREAGYTKVDAYTPFPITELDDGAEAAAQPRAARRADRRARRPAPPATGSSTGRRPSSTR